MENGYNGFIKMQTNGMTQNIQQFLAMEETPVHSGHFRLLRKPLAKEMCIL